MPGLPKMSKRYEQESRARTPRRSYAAAGTGKDESKRMDIDDFETVRRYTDATTITKAHGRGANRSRIEVPRRKAGRYYQPASIFTITASVP